MQDAFDTFPVMVEASQACPLYCGRVIKGINPNVETPLWMLSRLERSGIRSISAPVDITNFVMLEMGQPLHAFDLAKLKGGLRVRLAGRRIPDPAQWAAGELRPDMLIIADETGPIALAGIMGVNPLPSRNTARTCSWNRPSSGRMRLPGARAYWGCPPIRRTASNAEWTMPRRAPRWNVRRP